MDNTQIMLGRIDERTISMAKDIGEIKEHLKQQDIEIDSLKKFRFKFAGGVVSLSTAASLAIAWFSRKH